MQCSHKPLYPEAGTRAFQGIDPTRVKKLALLAAVSRFYRKVRRFGLSHSMLSEVCSRNGRLGDLDAEGSSFQPSHVPLRRCSRRHHDARLVSLCSLGFFGSFKCRQVRGTVQAGERIEVGHIRLSRNPPARRDSLGIVRAQPEHHFSDLIFCGPHQNNI